MTALKFKRFTRPQLLQGICRSLLIRFLEKFQPDLERRGLVLPGPELPEEEWARAVARWFAAPEQLPEGLCEALYAIDEMATRDGQEQLGMALAEAGLELALEPGATRQDIALQAWLSAPALLARIHNRQRLLRLTAFEYFGTPLAPADRPPVRAPDDAVLQSLSGTLDAWFDLHQRGRNTCRIELHCFQTPGDAAPGEFWFLVRHGDTFTRAPKVEEQRTEILHFRPQRDDVVVYCPTRDELRINARSRGERDLYVSAFGAHLRGREDYFSRRHTYTLEPLRTEGRDVLLTEGLPGLTRATLRKIETVEDGTDNVLTLAARDLFEADQIGDADAVPGRGRIRSAVFDLHFAGSPRPRPMEIRLPNVLKLRRHCDLHLVEGLISRFRIAA